MEKAFEYFSNKKPIRCPVCGSKKVVPILWGLPSEEGGRRAHDGEVVLGGCCVSDRDPSWQCRNCGTQIYREELRRSSGKDGRTL